MHQGKSAVDLANVGQAFWDDSGELDSIQTVLPPLGTAPFLASALASAGVGTWQLDTETGLVAMDATASSLLGLGPFPHHTSSFDLVIDEDRERLWASVGKMVREGTPHEIEYRIRTASGEVRWIYSRSREIPTGPERARYLSGIVYDVTERKQAQSALTERERQLSAIIDSLPGIAYRCSLEDPGRILFIGGAVEQMTGCSPEEFLSGALDWKAMIHPQDRKDIISKASAAVRDRTSFEVEYRIVRPDGELRWVHERGGATYSESGVPLFLEGFVHDIHEQRTAEDRLRDTEERYRLVSQAALEVIWDIDLATQELTFNDAITTVLRHHPEIIRPTAQWWREQVHPDDYERVSQALGSLIEGRESRYAGEHRFRRGDGSYADIYTRCVVMRDAQGRPVRLLGSLMDLSELKLADAALRESEAINRSIVEASIDCVMLIDLDGTIQFMNASGARGMEVEDVTSFYGLPWESLWPTDTGPALHAALKTAQGGGIGRFTASGQTARGNTRWGEVVISPVFGDDGKPVRLVAISRDITGRREAEDRLLWSATRDTLTQLPNRALFQRTLNDAVTKARRDGTKVGLLLLDLDHFKQVNDTLGHDAGDALLKTVASRFEAFCADECGGGSLAARLGGDEFALIVEDATNVSELTERANAFLARLREPFVHAGRILDCHATVGAALFPDHGAEPQDLLKSADIALYAAKSARRGQAVTFRPEHRAELQERQSMMQLARNALNGNSIRPYYQPKIRLDDGTVHGFEALLRWRDPRSGLQLPATISAAFDNIELAAAISDRIIDQVIVDMRRWLDRDLPFGHVAVNAAAAEFRSDRFAESVLHRLQAAGIPPSRLQLEVTETVFLGRGAEYVERALKLLSDAGVSVALDDFGTGYASLRHLKHFPVDVIKIDRSFVQNMETDPEDAAIIEAVLNLGKSLRIDVVAEGIETVSHAQRLRQMNCLYGQGFLFSRAVSARRVPALIASRGGASRSEAKN